MPLAQVIRIDERRAIERRPARREAGSAKVVQLFRAPDRSQNALAVMAHDEDRFAGRGRDPG